MIAVTRLKGDAVLYLNPDLVETIEQTPDTVITLVDGKRLLVAEPATEIVSAIAAWRASILAVATQISRPEPAAAEGGER